MQSYRRPHAFHAVHHFNRNSAAFATLLVLHGMQQLRITVQSTVSISASCLHASFSLFQYRSLFSCFAHSVFMAAHHALASLLYNRRIGDNEA